MWTKLHNGEFHTSNGEIYYETQYPDSTINILREKFLSGSGLDVWFREEFLTCPGYLNTNGAMIGKARDPRFKSWSKEKYSLEIMKNFINISREKC